MTETPALTLYLIPRTRGKQVPTMSTIMQKSALTNRQPHLRDAKHVLPPPEKGQKFEPFWTAAFGSDRQSLARQQKSDQKR
ncbi:hypothetical protein [Ideonella sp.]|uniref:hypothetical protein n=1 Tax=Ideonella sp. TaxID=1929293 RepID=UPI0035AFDD66